MATPTQQYIQLMTKRYHLCLKRLSRPEEVDDHPLEQIQELEHPEFMARFGPSRQADGICDRDRGGQRISHPPNGGGRLGIYLERSHGEIVCRPTSPRQEACQLL